MSEAPTWPESDVASGEPAPDMEARVANALRKSGLASEGGAYTAIFEERAMNAAGSSRRPVGPLRDTTFAVKDMIAVRGHRRGGGSRSREHAETCDEDAPVVATILEAGAVLIGLTVLHELAFGVTGINAYAGTPVNPAGAGRIPGGSSSGSAVAVAAGSVDFALGTDTGGSIRIPAALCGVVGYKPAYGSWPTAGVLALAPSLDHVGVLGRSVAAVASVDLLFGSSARDGDEPSRRTFGAHRGQLARSEPAVADAVGAALDRLSAAHSLVDIEFPSDDEVLELTNTIMFFEAANEFRTQAMDPDSGLGDDVRARLETGLRIAPDDYERARARARLLTDEVRAAMASVDVVIGPTVPICAPTLAEAPELGPRLVAHTRLANMTGLPAISLPLPTPVLPVGLQLMGLHSDVLLAHAVWVEEHLR
jgi:Asp-tRNA(Asn)/Glu-tRNA(Gln) amidotransferase A subunit family amidase